LSPCSSLQLTSAWVAPRWRQRSSSCPAMASSRLRRSRPSGPSLETACCRSLMDYPVAMRGRDEETGQFLSPSRSEQRRAALDVLALGERLAALTPTQLAKLPVPESLLPHIAETRRITAHVARKRQVAFLAKQMRREDDEVLDAI